MNQDTIRGSALDLYKAMRNRWHVAPVPVSVPLAPRYEFSTSPLRARPRTLNESRIEESKDPGGIPDYDPDSPEPRFVQMAKSEIRRRKDLRCRDCGFVGLPAPDQNCPECGGAMDLPSNQPQPVQMSSDQIRDAIRQQLAQQGEKKSSKKTEGIHRTISTHAADHDIHLSDLISHYGFRADGDRYLLKGDPTSFLKVNSHSHWIHKHHGVHHEGHGHRSLANHLARYL